MRARSVRVSADGTLARNDVRARKRPVAKRGPRARSPETRDEAPWFGYVWFGRFATGAGGR